MTTLVEINSARPGLRPLDRAWLLAQRRRYLRSLTPLELIETALSRPNSTALDRLIRQQRRASQGALTSGEVADLLARLDRKGG